MYCFFLIGILNIFGKGLTNRNNFRVKFIKQSSGGLATLVPNLFEFSPLFKWFNDVSATLGYTINAEGLSPLIIFFIIDINKHGTRYCIIHSLHSLEETRVS